MHLQAAKVGIFYPLETYREQWKKGENGFSLFAQEVLEHAGVTFKFVERGRVTKTDVDVLVVPHALLVEQDDLPQLIEFVQEGGQLFNSEGRERWENILASCRCVVCRRVMQNCRRPMKSRNRSSF